MQIQATENNYSLVQFSDAERDVFAKTLPFLDENYDDLEFSFREFSKDDLNSLQAKIKAGASHSLSPTEVRTLGSVLSYISNFLEDFFEDEDPAKLSEGHLDAAVEMYKSVVARLKAVNDSASGAKNG